MRTTLLGLTLAILLAAPALAQAHHHRPVVAVYAAPVVSFAPVVATVSYRPAVEVTPVVVSPPTVYVPVRPVTAVRYYAPPPVVVESPTIYVVPRR